MNNIQETKEMIEEMCRPEKINVVAEISREISKLIINLAEESKLSTDEILAIVYLTTDAMEESVDRYEEIMGVMDMLKVLNKG